MDGDEQHDLKKINEDSRNIEASGHVYRVPNSPIKMQYTAGVT